MFYNKKNSVYQLRKNYDLSSIRAINIFGFKNYTHHIVKTY